MARTVAQDPHPVDRHVGRCLAELRISRGRTQSDLAQALKLTFQQVQKYEKGANRISASKLFEAATFLGVGIDYFFDGLRDAPPDLPDDDGTRAVGGPPPTRHSVEMARWSRRLSLRRQKLALDLIISLSGSGASQT